VCVVQHLEVLHEDLLEYVEKFRLLLDELRLDRLVEVLVRHRVVQDPDVREVLQDRLDLDLVHVSLDDLRDRRDLAEARLLDAAHLRRLDLDALVPEESGEVALLDRIERRGGAALLLLVHAVEHSLRFVAVGTSPVRVLRLRVVPLRGLGHIRSPQMNRNANRAITSMMKLCLSPFGIFPVSKTPARMPSPRPCTTVAMKNAIRIWLTTPGRSWASGLWTAPPVEASAPLASSIFGRNVTSRIQIVTRKTMKEM